MKSTFSKEWNKSKQPRKQRKYLAQAPIHIKGKMLGAHLSKDLLKKYNKRSIRARTGDKVKVMIGMFKGKSGKIESVDVKNSKVYIENVDYVKKDGSKTKYPIHASNVMITELNIEDKKRKEKIENNMKSQKEKSKPENQPKKQ